tara:strand:- start:76 stop:309 length:234 start_codon:yes stop_codon:yes gene_type:complete
MEYEEITINSDDCGNAYTKLIRIENERLFLIQQYDGERQDIVSLCFSDIAKILLEIEKSYQREIKETKLNKGVASEI